MFKVSDKVVCVRRVKSREYFNPVPEVGKVYVIREVDESDENDVGLRLVSIQGTHEDGKEVWLSTKMFRPIADLQNAKAKDRPSKPVAIRTIPVFKVKWMTPKEEHQLFGSVDRSMKMLRSVFDAVHNCVAKGGWRDPEGQLLACVMNAWDERRESMDADASKKAGRAFFSSHPKPGNTVKIVYAGSPLSVQVAWAYRGAWHDGLYRTDAVCRSFDGRYFLVRETEPHVFCPPPHASWLRGLLRIKRITLKTALLFALRDGLPAFSFDTSRRGGNGGKEEA